MVPPQTAVSQPGSHPNHDVKGLEELIDETVEALAAQEQATKAAEKACQALQLAQREAAAESSQAASDARRKLAAAERGIEAERASHAALEKASESSIPDPYRARTVPQAHPGPSPLDFLFFARRTPSSWGKWSG